jgi:hypothetical protein
VHQVGDQPSLYYDARSTNHQDFSLILFQLQTAARLIVIGLFVYKCMFFFTTLKAEKFSSAWLATYKLAYVRRDKSTIKFYSTLRLLMSYIYGAPILDVSRSHTTTQHSR